MNITQNAAVVSVFLAATTTQALAQGYLVANGVTSSLNAGEISVLHDPVNPSTGSSYTGFFLRPQSQTVFAFDPVVDIGVRVFFVPQNGAFTLDSILAHSYTELTVPNAYAFGVGSQFYVGLYTGNMAFAPQDGIYNDPLFGWARLVNNAGTIQLVDGALAYKGGGIFVGTQTIIPVPEPGTLGLVGLGGLALVLGRLGRPSSVAKLWRPDSVTFNRVSGVGEVRCLPTGGGAR